MANDLLIQPSIPGFRSPSVATAPTPPGTIKVPQLTPPASSAGTTAGRNEIGNALAGALSQGKPADTDMAGNPLQPANAGRPTDTDMAGNPIKNLPDPTKSYEDVGGVTLPFDKSPYHNPYLDDLMSQPMFKNPEPDIWQQFDMARVQGWYTGAPSGITLLGSYPNPADHQYDTSTPGGMDAYLRASRMYSDLAEAEGMRPPRNLLETSVRGLGGFLGSSQEPGLMALGIAGLAGSMEARLGGLVTKDAVTGIMGWINGARTPVEKAARIEAVNIGFAVPYDATVQGLRVQAGLQPTYDPRETYQAGLIGALLPGGMYAGWLAGKSGVAALSPWVRAFRTMNQPSGEALRILRSSGLSDAEIAKMPIPDRTAAVAGYLGATGDNPFVLPGETPVVPSGKAASEAASAGLQGQPPPSSGGVALTPADRAEVAKDVDTVIANRAEEAPPAGTPEDEQLRTALADRLAQQKTLEKDGMKPEEIADLTPEQRAEAVARASATETRPPPTATPRTPTAEAPAGQQLPAAPPSPKPDVAPEIAEAITTPKAAEPPPPVQKSTTIDGKTVAFPDEEHARLYALGQMMEKGEQIDDTEATAVGDKFSGFVQGHGVYSLALDYARRVNAQVAAAAGESVLAGDVITGAEAKAAWNAYQADKQRAPDHAAEAVTKAQQGAGAAVPVFKPDEIKPSPGERSGIYLFDPRELKSDPETFQFKDNTDENGISPLLKSVTSWDPDAAGQIIVYQSEDGSLSVADGHQRWALANRLLGNGTEDSILIPGSLYRAADGFSAEDVMLIAAMKNIKEGSGSIMDAAKILRRSPEDIFKIAEIGREQTKQAVALTRLNDDVWRMAVNKAIQPRDAAVIGELIPGDAELQIAAAKAIAQLKPANALESELLVARVKQAGLMAAERGAQGDFLAGITGKESTVNEEIGITSRAIRTLAKDKNILKRVATNASRIEAVGSKVARQATMEAADQSAQLAQLVEKVAFSKGPVRDALTQLAKEVKGAKRSLNDAVEAFITTLRGQDRPGAAGGGPIGAGRRGDEAGGPRLFGSDRVAQIERDIPTAREWGDRLMLKGEERPRTAAELATAYAQRLAELQNNPDLTRQDIIATAKVVTADSSIRSKAEALRKIASLQREIVISRQKTEATAGRSAAFVEPYNANQANARAAGRTGEALPNAQAGGLPGPGGVSGGNGAAQSALERSPQVRGPNEPLVGLPSQLTVPGRGRITVGPFPVAREAARAYMAEAGLPYDPPTHYVKVSPQRATRIAQAFDAMKHQPDNPEVKASYDALIKETLAQYQAIKKTGLKVELIQPGQADPYAASPRLGQLDIIENNHWWLFPTDSGFGSINMVTDNPMLALTGEKIGDHVLRANDVFRIVHDYFGHLKEGVGFRADGEENAWLSHSAMYSPLARRAMTTETRGQNSWVNYGPFGEKNRTANGAQTVYADQKIGLLPEWAITAPPESRGIAANLPNFRIEFEHRQGQPEIIEGATAYSGDEQVGRLKLITPVDSKTGAFQGTRAEAAYTNPKARGKGVMTALYAAVERASGVQMVPSHDLLPAGLAFWRKYRPSAVPPPAADIPVVDPTTLVGGFQTRQADVAERTGSLRATEFLPRNLKQFAAITNQPKLTAEETKAVDDIAHPSILNTKQRLRGNEPMDSFGEPLNAIEFEQQVARIDAAMAKSQLSRDVVLYRGLDAVDMGKLLEVEPGTIISDPSFLNTSVKAAVAKGYAGENGGTLVVGAPKGAPAVTPMPRGNTAYEVVLPRNARLLVTAVNRDTRTITVRFLPGEAPRPEPVMAMAEPAPEPAFGEHLLVTRDASVPAVEGPDGYLYRLKQSRGTFIGMRLPNNADEAALYFNPPLGKKWTAQEAADAIQESVARRAAVTSAKGYGAQNREVPDYLQQAMRNLQQTSRTARGTIDTSAAPEKAGYIVAGAAKQSAKIAQENFADVIATLYAQKDDLPITGEAMQELIDDVARRINEGIVKDGALDRNFATVYPSTPPEDLPIAKRQFADELAARLHDDSADPVETAAWIEWRANYSDHFWKDGVGKTSRALAAIPLMKAGMALPDYQKAFTDFSLAPKQAFRADDGGSYLGPQWEKFLDAYRVAQQRGDLRSMIDAGAQPDELVAHPLVRKAAAEMDAVQPTDIKPGYATDEWWASRNFIVDGKQVTGFDAAQQAMVDKFFRMAWEEADLPPGKVESGHEATIIVGPPAAGKSSIANPIARKLMAAIVDSDEIKKFIPEWGNGIGANAVHEESDLITRRLMASLIEHGVNMVLPKVGGKASSIEKLIATLREANYKVTLMNMAVPDDEAFRRMIGRFLDSDRLINTTYAKAIDGGPTRTYLSLKEKADAYAEVDGSGKAPVVADDPRRFLVGVNFGRGAGEAARVPAAKPQRLGGADRNGGGDSGSNAAGVSGLRQGRGAGAPQAAGVEDQAERFFIQHLRGTPLRGEQPRVSVPAGPGTPKAPRLADITEKLQQALAINLREGRLPPGKKTSAQGGRVLGVYNKDTGITRLRERENYDVLAHEAGHNFYEPNKAELSALVATHKVEIAQLAPPQYPGWAVPEEGFAEFFRLYMTNRAYAEKEAPGFFKAFDGWLRGKQPQLAKDLDEAEKLYDDMIHAADKDVVTADIVTSGHPPLMTRLKEATGGLGGDIKRGRLPGSERLPTGQSLFSLFDRIYTWAVDELHPINRAVRVLTYMHYLNTGKVLDIEASENAYKLARLATNSYQAGHLDITLGVTPYRGGPTGKMDPVGPALPEALEIAVGKDWSGSWRFDDLMDFGGYLVSRRAVKLWEAYDRGEIRNVPHKLSKATHQQAIIDYEKAHPAFPKAAEMVYEWNRNLYKKKLDAGIISQDWYDHTIGYEDYVPFQRDFSDVHEEALRSAGKAGQNKQSVMKRFNGSLRSVINPIESMVSDAYSTSAIIARNDVIATLVSLARRAGPDGGAIAELIPAHELRPVNFDIMDALRAAGKQAGLNSPEIDDLLLAASERLDADTFMTTIYRQGEMREKGEPIVYFWEGGERKAVRLADGVYGKELFQALTHIGAEQSNWVVNFLAKPAGWLRTGVTTNPAFFLANYVRDQMTAFVINSKFIPGLSGARGIFDAALNTKMSRLYSYGGGIFGGTNVASLQEARVGHDIDALRLKGYSIRPMAVLEKVVKFTEGSETGTRLAMFREYFDNARKQGLSEYEAMVEGAFEARDYMDFGRHGSKMLAVRRLVTFFNAAVQGSDKVFRTLFADLVPFGKVFKGMPLSAEEKRDIGRSVQAWIKVAGLTALSATYAAVMKDDPEYQDASEYLRATSWLFKVPGGNWLAVPKPYEIATVLNMGERMVDAYNGDPTWFDRWRASWMTTLLPPIEAPGLMVPIDVAANYNRFRGSPIVSDTDLGLDPAQQFDRQTSEFSKRVGAALGISPAKIDYVLLGWGGSNVRDLLAMSDRLDPQRQSDALYDWPISGRFVKNISRGNDATDKFYKLVATTTGRLATKLNTYKGFLSAGNDAQAATFYAGLKDDEKVWVASQTADSSRQKQVHPLRRAYDVMGVYRSLEKDIINRNIKPTIGGDYVPKIVINPTIADNLMDLMGRAAAAEARNAMVAIGEPGWAKREVFDIQPYLDGIRHLSPAVANELNDRMYKAGVTSFEGVAKVWPQYRDRVLKDGPKAFTGDLRADALLGGPMYVPIGPSDFGAGSTAAAGHAPAPVR